MDKLDTAAAAVAVNGPEDDLIDWDCIDWGAAEKEVRRLRQRIFTASKAGDLKRVRNLQKLMLRSLEPEWEARFESRSYGFVRHEVRGIEGGGRPSRCIVAAM